VSAASLHFVLGGARSGKSRYAESLFAAEPACVYIATAQAFDDEMGARIAEHQERRDARWTTFDAPFDLVGALKEAGDRPVLVDCLTLWLTNWMLAEFDHDAAGERLVSYLSTRQAMTVLVSNEVGLGLVPETPLGRRFRDAQGRLNQRVAAAATRVVFVAAGLPLVMKGA
jgi:adenosyl cobinamide kinase/adenosyl cobinamide phosphate guanylyltransferase